MTTVLLDANALVMPFQFGINLDTELERMLGNPEVFVPSSVMEELKVLGRRDALQLAARYTVIQVNKRRDDGILEAAEKTGGAVVTNDKKLIDRLRKKNVPVISLRSKSHLELIGEIL